MKNINNRPNHPAIHGAASHNRISTSATLALYLCALALSPALLSCGSALPVTDSQSDSSLQPNATTNDANSNSDTTTQLADSANDDSSTARSADLLTDDPPSGYTLASTTTDQPHLARIVFNDGTEIDMWAHRDANRKVDYIRNYRIRTAAGREEYLLMDAASRVVRYRDQSGYLFQVHTYHADGNIDITLAGPDDRTYRQTINLFQEAARFGLTIPADALSSDPPRYAITATSPEGCAWMQFSLKIACRTAAVIETIKRSACANALPATVLTPSDGSCVWASEPDLGIPATVCDNLANLAAMECNSTSSLSEPFPSIFLPSTTDSDGDGIPDNWDNCPDAINADQTDADSDGDRQLLRQLPASSQQ